MEIGETYLLHNGANVTITYIDKEGDRVIFDHQKKPGGPIEHARWSPIGEAEEALKGAALAEYDYEACEWKEAKPNGD